MIRNSHRNPKILSVNISDTYQSSVKMKTHISMSQLFYSSVAIIRQTYFRPSNILWVSNIISNTFLLNFLNEYDDKRFRNSNFS